MERLANRLQRKQQTRLALMFLDRYEGTHLKDIFTDRVLEGRRVIIEGHEVVNFGSDSFLGLDRDPRLQEAIDEAQREWGTHNGASRAFTSIKLYDEAESQLAQWLGVEDTLVYPSVTLANAALLPALADEGDLLIVDRQSHDSIQQGAKLAAADGAKVRELYPCQGAVLEQILQEERPESFVVAVDGMYSMSGRVAPLAELKEVVQRHSGWLYIDDAHGTGVVGSQGRGAAYEALGKLDDVLVVGSLSKAFSCLGAFVTCTPRLKRILKIRSNNFIFGGPVPPPYLAAICRACEIIQSAEYEELQQRVRRLVDQLTGGVRELGLSVQGGVGPIVSVVIGDIERTLEAGRFLFDRGFYVQSATFPAVSITGGLLRILINANHTDSDVAGLIAAIGAMRESFGLERRS